MFLKSIENNVLTFWIFRNEGLTDLVEYHSKKMFEVKLREIKTVLTSKVTEESNVDEVIESVKQQIKEAKLPDIEVVRVVWDGLMDAVQWSGKNQQQNANSVLRQVRFYRYDEPTIQFMPLIHIRVPYSVLLHKLPMTFVLNLVGSHEKKKWES